MSKPHVAIVFRPERQQEVDSRPSDHKRLTADDVTGDVIVGRRGCVGEPDVDEAYFVFQCKQCPRHVPIHV